MKYIDNFLKFIKTDRNTFVTYILTLISSYILIDRLIEIMFMIFTGMSHTYWGPIEYSFALLALIFAFNFSFSSKFAKSDVQKLRIFNSYVICLYILSISAIVQWINSALWIGMLSLPNFTHIASEYSNLFRPAFSAISLYIPLVTFYQLFQWLVMTVNSTEDITDSIFDYKGLSLASTDKTSGKYSFEIRLCSNNETGADVIIPETKRYESLLAVGVTGAGKTTMLFEPMIARDMEKKYIFNELSKEMGFTALKAGIATLNCPYDNSYLNENFNLNMLRPNEDKLDLYIKYMKNMILGKLNGKIVYKDMGLTYISAEIESINKMVDVANKFNLKVNLVDPSNNDSLGLNPFNFKDPIKTGIVISNVLKEIFAQSRPDVQIAFRETASMQIIENLSILLKEMYPRLNNNALPNIEDLLDLMNNFKHVEEYCEQLKLIPELNEKYKILIKYFENSFYSTGHDLDFTQKSVYTASTQLDNLLRYPGLKKVLCSRNNNINFDNALKNGELTLICTRRGDLGSNTHKAFGIFSLLLMQHSVLSRPGNESNRLSHFLYIDDFTEFICRGVEPIFTVYRKYKVGCILTSQTLSQLNNPNINCNFKDEILANVVNKVVFGNALPEDAKWWEVELQDKRDWKYSVGVEFDPDKGGPAMDTKYGNVKYGWKQNYSFGKVMALKNKQIIYKIKNSGGKSEVGKGTLDFLEAKYKEYKKVKEYNFEKFTNGISDLEQTEQSSKEHRGKFAKATFANNPTDYDSSIDPINHSTQKSKYEFDNENPIITNNNNNNE